MANKITKLMLNGEEYEIREYQAGWQPGANTIAYYEFDNNLNDSSGNNINLFITTGSVTYGTAIGGGKYVYFNRNTRTDNASLGNMSANASDGYTVSFYWQPKELLTVGSSHAVADIGNAGSHPIILRIDGSIGCWGDLQPSAEYSATVDTWYHVVCIRYNGYDKIYVNSVFIDEVARSALDGNYNMTLRLNQVGNTSSSTYSNNNYLGEFIMENKAWTETEIQNYFNSTKSLYGIS